MTGIKVFFIAPTDRYQRSLRRVSESATCTAVKPPYNWCDCSVYLDTIQAEKAPASGHVDWPRDDPRWPKACARCNRPFEDADSWLVRHSVLYRREDTGEEFPLDMAPIGACWNAHWLADHGSWAGPDGRCLIVRLPGLHEWTIDGRAANCTRPDDDVHKCWVRHGRPEDGTLHVDKNGNTCSAGAGSIVVPNWHGFLRHGHLVTC